jgi:hypothetical protein
MNDCKSDNHSGQEKSYMNVKKIAGFINNSKKTQNILKHINKNPAVYGAASSFVLASIMRPSLIGVMPFKEKKDKTYSQASAVAAGVVELGITCAVFLPLNNSIRKASDKLYKTSGSYFEKNAPALRQFKSLTNRGIKALTLVPVSLLRFAWVTPIVDLLFRRGKHESK